MQYVKIMSEKLSIISERTGAKLMYPAKEQDAKIS